MSDIKLVANLADRLARRILEGVESGTFTADELRGSPDVVLVTNAAMLLRRAGAEFPPGLRRLAENDAASRARVVRQALGAVRDSPVARLRAAASFASLAGTRHPRAGAASRRW